MLLRAPEARPAILSSSTPPGSVVNVRGLHLFGAGKDTGQPRRIMNEHRQVLRTDAEGCAAIFEGDQRCRIRVAFAEKARGLFHSMRVNRGGQAVKGAAY